MHKTACVRVAARGVQAVATPGDQPTPSLEPLLEPLLLEPSLPFTISTFTICNLVTSDKPSLWRGVAEKMYVTKNPRDVCVL